MLLALASWASTCKYYPEHIQQKATFTASPGYYSKVIGPRRTSLGQVIWWQGQPLSTPAFAGEEDTMEIPVYTSRSVPGKNSVEDL